MQDMNRIIQVLYRLIRFKQSNQSVEKLLFKRGYDNIAVYGFTYLGKALIYDLDNSEIHVNCLIDKNGNTLHMEIPTYTLEEVNTEGIDAVICCYIGDETENIVNDIRERFSCDVITMEELIYEL